MSALTTALRGRIRVERQRLDFVTELSTFTKSPVIPLVGDALFDARRGPGLSKLDLSTDIEAVGARLAFGWHVHRDPYAVRHVDAIPRAVPN
jgi:hypothetical protein